MKLRVGDGRHCQHSSVAEGNIHYEGELVLRWWEMELGPMWLKRLDLKANEGKGCHGVGLFWKLTL